MKRLNQIKFRDSADFKLPVEAGTGADLLAKLQRQMAGALFRPLNGGDGQKRFLAKDGKPMRAVVAVFIKPSSRTLEEQPR